MDFSNDDITLLSQQTGASPDMLRQQLESDGHTVGVPQPGPMPTPGAPAAPPQQWSVGLQNLGAPAPQERRDLSGMFPSELQQQVRPTQVQPGSQFARTTPVREAQAPQQAQTVQRAGVRAQGLASQRALQLQQQQAQAAGGGLGGARGLYAQRQRQLESEFADAASEFQRSAERVNELQKSAIAVEEQKLQIEAGAARDVLTARQRLNEQRAEADRLDLEKRTQEDQMLAGVEQDIDRERQELKDRKVVDSRTDNDRMASLVALALAAAGDALVTYGRRDSNFSEQTLAAIDAGIERDMAEQRRQIAEGLDAVDARERGLGRLYGRVESERARRDLTKASYYDAFADRMSDIEANSNNETAKLAAGNARQAFELEAEKLALSGRAAAVEDTRKRLRDFDDKRFEDQVKAASAAAKPRESTAVRGLVALDPDNPPTEEDRKKAQAFLSQSNAVGATIQKLRALAAKGSTLNKTERAKAIALLETLTPQWSNQIGSGAPSEEQTKALREGFVNPTELNIANAEAVYEDVDDTRRAITNGQVEPYGYTIGSSQQRMRLE